LPTITNRNSNIVLYADDTSIVVTDTNRDDYNLHAYLLFTDINNWFQNNLLNLNLSRSHYLEFKPMKQYRVNMQIQYNYNYISKVSQTKFLGLIVDDTLSWKEHIDKLIKRMSSAIYAVRQVKHALPIETLKIIYSVHIHSIVSYGLILGGNSPGPKKVFYCKRKSLESFQILDPGTPVGKFS
jgi:hypothetical protein